MFRGQTGFRQRDNVDRGVPNRRHARLDPEIFRIVDEQYGKIFCGFRIDWMILGVAERAQCNERIQHCGEHRRQSVAPFADPLQHPALSFFQSAFAHRAPAEFGHDLQSVIRAQEKISPGKKTRVARERKVLVLGAEGIQFMELLHPR